MIKLKRTLIAIEAVAKKKVTNGECRVTSDR